jgi:hypothetical protein
VEHAHGTRRGRRHGHGEQRLHVVVDGWRGDCPECACESADGLLEQPGRRVSEHAHVVERLGHDHADERDRWVERKQRIEPEHDRLKRAGKQPRALGRDELGSGRGCAFSGAHLGPGPDGRNRVRSSRSGLDRAGVTDGRDSWLGDDERSGDGLIRSRGVLVELDRRIGERRGFGAQQPKRVFGAHRHKPVLAGDGHEPERYDVNGVGRDAGRGCLG